MIKTHIVLYIIDVLALLFLFRLLIGNNLLSKNRIKAFSYGIVFTVLAICSEAGTILASSGIVELRSFNILCNVIGFAVTPIIPMVLIAVFDTKILQVNKLILIPTILNIIATALSPWWGLIFFVDSNNNYERGSIFALFVAVYIINILLLIMYIWYTCQRVLYPIRWKTAALCLFALAGTLVQVLVPSIYVSWHCVTLTLFVLYIILSEFECSFDPLTKMYNRATYEKVSKQLKAKNKFTVVIMDINDFKEINDTYGHNYGDTVLRKVAVIIRDSFDNHCCCYRIGGDEFCVICRDANIKKLERQLKRITDKLTKQRESDTCLPRVSYGYSIFQGGKTMDFKKIVKEADDQMYYHKQLLKKNGN